MKNALQKLKLAKSVQTLPLEDLLDNSVQPSNRTSPETLAPLIESIKRHGLVDPPYVADLGHGRFMKINGHRRCAAYASLGYTEIPCRVVRGVTQSEAEQLFAEIDSVTKPIRSSGSFEDRGGPGPGPSGAAS